MRAIALFSLIVLQSSVLAQSFVNFESPVTRGVTISADGSRLYALNTPDNRLAIYSLRNPRAPLLLREIKVGLEPVAVIARTADELWVACHLSDSISIVSISRGIVVDTIRCGDEPADIVFAGSPSRAFVSLATSREVLVLDATTRARIGSIPVFGDEPRAMVASASGSRVFVTVQRSGNRTTIVPETMAPPPPPPTRKSLPKAPGQGIIVDSEDPQWKPILGVHLPDYDLFEIDANSRTIVRRVSSIGTSLANLCVDPLSGDLWVANTHARNRIRFEPNLRGHIIDSRVSRIEPNSTVHAFDLNPSIDYKVLPNPAAIAIALSQPTDLVFSPDGQELFVAAFGTDRIAILNRSGQVLSRIEIGGTAGSSTVPRSKRGPRNLSHHPTQPILYVLNRLANSLSVIDTSTRKVVAELDMIYDPTPRWLREGRGFLYDAKLSGNGTAACAACHVDGTIDGLAWDLGDRGGSMTTVQVANGKNIKLHPMKGPMTTQTLKGLAGLAPFHWRGDKPRLQDFNGAFDSLMGKTTLNTADMDSFARFMESIAFGPNPNQNLDRTYSRLPAGLSAQDGLSTYTTMQFVPGTTCIDCHALPSGSNRKIFDGMTLGEPQPFKVPQLRNIYKRTGKRASPQGRTSGFGFVHEGADDSISEFLRRPVFGSLVADQINRKRLEAFVESLDTGTAPSVGYSLTVTSINVDSPDTASSVNLLVTQAAAGNCDLTATAEVDGELRSYQFNTVAQTFMPDRTGEPTETTSSLATLIRANRATVTLLGVPPGSGHRIGIDRDLDGKLDRDERGVVFGQPSPACANSITLFCNSPANLGNGQFAVTCYGARPLTNGALLIGTTRSITQVLDLGLLIAQPLTLPLFAGQDGGGASALPIPADPALRGLKLNCQAVVGHSCGTFGLAASAGLEFTIQ